MSGMDKTLFQMKFTAKQLEREAKKMDKKKDEMDKKAFDSKTKGDMEKATIFAGEAIRNKNMALQYTRLGARMEAVAARVESAIRMKTFAASMGQAINGMDGVLATMDPVKINTMMDRFEKQFEDLDVGAKVLDESIARANAGAMPQDEVAAYLDALDDAAASRLGSAAGRIGVGSGPVGTGAAAAPERVASAVGAPQGGPEGQDGQGKGPGNGGEGGAAAGAGGGAGGGGGHGASVADALAARLAALRK